jgi:membrane protease YdiL (CAAX protease family)
MIQAFFALLAAVLFLSALLTPPVYSLLVYSLGAEGMWPFSRVFDRVVMVCAFALLVIFRQRFSLYEVKLALATKDLWSEGKKVFLWMLVTFSISLVVLTLIVGNGELVWSTKPGSYVISKMALVIPAALIISLIEETFFRLILLNGLKRKLPLPVASIISSFLYAVAHFVSPVKTFEYKEFNVWAGFEYLTLLTNRFVEPGILSAGCGLFLVGLALCCVISTTRSLYICLGLHAGWVAIIKFAHYATDVAPGYAFLSGGGRRYFLVAQPLAWLSIGLILITVLLWHRYRGRKKYD